MEDKNNFDLTIKTSDGHIVDIPIMGSLGLLALGDIGLMAWRKKKYEALRKFQDEKNNKK